MTQFPKTVKCGTYVEDGWIITCLSMPHSGTIALAHFEQNGDPASIRYARLDLSKKCWLDSTFSHCSVDWLYRMTQSTIAIAIEQFGVAKLIDTAIDNGLACASAVSSEVLEAMSRMEVALSLDALPNLEDVRVVLADLKRYVVAEGSK